MQLSVLSLITSIVLLSLSGLTWADSFSNPSSKNWQLKVDNEALVHTRKLEGSNYHVVRLVVEVESTPEKIVAAFGKGDGCVTWLSVCISSKAIEKISDDNALIYSVMRMPWPLRTRDYVFRTVIERFKQTGVITATQTSEQESHPKTNFIRMLTKSKFVLEPINSTRSKITWYIHPNLGGNAFPSLVNPKAYKETLRDLLALKRLLEK